MSETKRMNEKRRRRTDPVLDKMRISLDLILERKISDIDHVLRKKGKQDPEEEGRKMEDDVPTLEESGKIKEVSGKKREEEVKKKEEDGSKRKKLNLLTAALIEKILSMEKQSQQIKAESDAQTVFVSQQLFYLEAQLRKKQLKIEEELQDKDAVIAAQKQEIDQLRRTVLELSAKQSLYGSLRRPKRERPPAAELYSSSDSSSPGSSPKHLQLARQLSDGPRVLSADQKQLNKMAETPCVNLSRQTKLISRGTERPKLKQAISVGNLNLESEDNQKPRGILKPTFNLPRKPPVPSRQAVNEKLNIAHVSEDSGRESDVRSSPGRESPDPSSLRRSIDSAVKSTAQINRRCHSIDNSYSVDNSYRLDSGNSSIDYSDSCLDNRFVAPGMNNEQLERCFEQYILPGQDVNKQGKRVSFQHQGTFDSAPSSIDSAYASSQFLDTSCPSTFIQEKKSPAVVKTEDNKNTESSSEILNVGDPKTPQNEENPQNEKTRQKSGSGFTRNVGKAEEENETKFLANVGLRQEPRRRSMLGHIPDTSFSLANQPSPNLRDFSHSNNRPFTAGITHGTSKGLKAKLLPCSIPTVPMSSRSNQLKPDFPPKSTKSVSASEQRTVQGIKKKAPNVPPPAPPLPKVSLSTPTKPLGARASNSTSESQRCQGQTALASDAMPPSIFQDDDHSSLNNLSSQNMEFDPSLSNRFKAVISEITHRSPSRKDFQNALASSRNPPNGPVAILNSPNHTKLCKSISLESSPIISGLLRENINLIPSSSIQIKSVSNSFVVNSFEYCFDNQKYI